MDLATGNFLIGMMNKDVVGVIGELLVEIKVRHMYEIYLASIRKYFQAESEYFATYEQRQKYLVNNFIKNGISVRLATRFIIGTKTADIAIKRRAIFLDIFRSM